MVFENCVSSLLWRNAGVRAGFESSGSFARSLRLEAFPIARSGATETDARRPVCGYRELRWRVLNRKPSIWVDEAAGLGRRWAWAPHLSGLSIRGCGRMCAEPPGDGSFAIAPASMPWRSLVQAGGTRVVEVCRVERTLVIVAGDLADCAVATSLETLGRAERQDRRASCALLPQIWLLRAKRGRPAFSRRHSDLGERRTK